MVGEVSDLARKGALRVGVALQINVGVAVQVERRQPIYVLAQHWLPRLVQEEHLRAMPVLQDSLLHIITHRSRQHRLFKS